MRENLNSLQQHAVKYLTEPEYEKFVKYLNERNSSDISVRMHANVEISRMVKHIRKQVKYKRKKKVKVTQ